MIMPRLVLGTARIAGGADAPAALALIRSALDAGIGHVDTAPSYGLGTAEAVVGQALAGFDHVRVTAKLGSARPSQPWLRSLARRVKRAMAGSTTLAAALPPGQIEERTGNDFSTSAMSRSLALSRERLGRIDVLLLHDIAVAEVSAAVLADLARLGMNVGAATGYAGYARWHPELDRAFPADAIAQCAPDPAWLRATPALPTDRKLWLHSLVKTGLALAGEDTQFAAALDRGAALVTAPDLLTARLAALYALAAVRMPAARLLITSSRQDRLSRLLQAIAAIDRDHQAHDIAALFDGQAG